MQFRQTGRKKIPQIPTKIHIVIIFFNFCFFNRMFLWASGKQFSQRQRLSVNDRKIVLSNPKKIASYIFSKFFYKLNFHLDSLNSIWNAQPKRFRSNAKVAIFCRFIFVFFSLILLLRTRKKHFPPPYGKNFSQCSKFLAQNRNIYVVTVFYKIFFSHIDLLYTQKRSFHIPAEKFRSISKSFSLKGWSLKFCVFSFSRDMFLWS